MKASNLEAALRARPFRPFELRVDGEVIVIRHPEQVMLADHKTSVVVDGVDRIHIFDTHHISKIAQIRRSSGGSGAKLQAS